jgi:hypothetical protein
MTFDLRDNHDSEDNYPPGDKVTDTVYRRFHNSLFNSGRTVRTGIELVRFWGAGPRVVALAKPGESSPFIATIEPPSVTVGQPLDSGGLFDTIGT